MEKYIFQQISKFGILKLCELYSKNFTSNLLLLFDK